MNDLRTYRVFTTKLMFVRVVQQHARSVLVPTTQLKWLAHRAQYIILPNRAGTILPQHDMISLNREWRQGGNVNSTRVDRACDHRQAYRMEYVYTSWKSAVVLTPQVTNEYAVVKLVSSTCHRRY